MSVCVYMYVCMYVYIYIYIYVSIPFVQPHTADTSTPDDDGCPFVPYVLDVVLL